jgi:hypothetical protein
MTGRLQAKLSWLAVRDRAHSDPIHDDSTLHVAGHTWQCPPAASATVNCGGLPVYPKPPIRLIQSVHGLCEGLIAREDSVFGG